MTNQPEWIYAGQIGDVDPLTYGGGCVLTDKTETYAPEVVLISEPCDDTDLDDIRARWQVFRICLEPCTFRAGVLSDNSFHPDKSAWFQSELTGVAETMGMDELELINLLCSSDANERAAGYQCLWEYHGFANFDESPSEYTKDEIEKFWNDQPKEVKS